mgnify:CR=1 FL=1
MRLTALDEAMLEARRFLARAGRVRVMSPHVVPDYKKESSALRRASMDLTRALAELRRP